MKLQILYTRFSLIAALLLAVYGAAGVLGYGLHSLWGCGHCHEGVCHLSPTTASLTGFNTDNGRLHSSGSIARAERQHQAHVNPAQEDCPICAFLVQAQSQFVFQMESACVDVIPTIPPAIFYSYDSPLLGTHPGRGPPSC